MIRDNVKWLANIKKNQNEEETQRKNTEEQHKKANGASGDAKKETEKEHEWKRGQGDEDSHHGAYAGAHHEGDKQQNGQNEQN